MAGDEEKEGMALGEGVDPQQAAQLVRELPEEELSRLLVGEVREAALGEVFRRFPEYVDPQRIGESEGVVEWLIAGDRGADRFLVAFAAGRCEIVSTAEPEARVTLELGAVEFLKLVTGNANPATMYLGGSLGLRGDVLFAIEMAGFLRVPGAEGVGAAGGAVDPSTVDAIEIAEAVRAADDRILRERMRGEVRDLILDEVIRRFPEYLNPAKAEGVSKVIGWKIGGRDDGGADRFRVVIRDGAVHAGRELDEEPDVTIVIGGVEFLKLVTGNLDPVMSFVTGKLKLRGDVAFAARLPGIFRIPSGRR